MLDDQLSLEFCIKKFTAGMKGMKSHKESTVMSY